MALRALAKLVQPWTAAIAALAVLATAPASANADYVWRNVVVGGGGFSPNLIFSRAERGLAYLRTDIGGIYRWDAQAAAWIPLQDGIAEGNYFGIESIAPDPVDPSTVYVAAGMYRRDGAAILRSRDRGAHWDVFPVSFRMGGNEDGRGLGERLAVDPNDTSILYFGSRHDGLMRSTDRGATWSRVRSFPQAGRGAPAQGAPTNAGVAFVVFDPASGSRGQASRTLFAGVADPGEAHLFRSDDAGETWRAVASEPRADLLPVKAELDAAGVLYIAYCNGVGPNGVTDGAVFKLDTRSGRWSNITPDRGANRAPSGYMGLSIDRQTPGTLVVASLNRWQPRDTIWRSTDGGATWREIYDLSRRDVSETPFLLWGEEQADFGWWMAGLAIDPFDSNRVAYTTGATIFLTEQIANADTNSTIAWRPWVKGVEETAVLTLTSLPEGPQLLSGFGDISGFAHEDLARSPTLQFTSPVFSNTNTIDYAGRAPNVVVRSGAPPHRAQGGEPTLAYSLDHGRTWAPLRAPALRGTNAQGMVEERRYDLTGDIAIITSADGAAFMVMTPVPVATRDRGRTWTPARGLPAFARPVADRVDAQRFYALDFDGGGFYASTDGGATFTRIAGAGLPGNLAQDQPTSREAQYPLIAAPEHAGDLWFISRQGLFRSNDGGASFAQVRSDLRVEALAFGKAPPGASYPALYAIGWRGDTRAIWRSDDQGRSWIRLTGAGAEFGRRFRCIAGDARVFGRVYVGTDGRGILYGEPRT
jgi:photosystem II stability/assembly factor-like uncharacterized protein